MNKENPISTYFDIVENSQTCLDLPNLIEDNFEKENDCELLKIQSNTGMKRNEKSKDPKPKIRITTKSFKKTKPTEPKNTKK